MFSTKLVVSVTAELTNSVLNCEDWASDAESFPCYGKELFDVYMNYKETIKDTCILGFIEYILEIIDDVRVNW